MAGKQYPEPWKTNHYSGDKWIREPGGDPGIYYILSELPERFLSHSLPHYIGLGADREIDYSGSGRSFGVGGAEKIPAFAVVGGRWWDSQVRYWIGRRVLGMGEDDARVRRGDEMLTFQYGL
ncbi:predicted protein [Histoplasma mississippiense (nom. inval.)]|uniref:predicted protein n=1 Tax=Ajellomyces capsulatus (strain NAm1 / WU24) TaxID=2059318 RepID=UPI000157B2CB|nr:predicted protein [Histoplasma mississippiense (nom. inval.)]EDN02308.1 predicted protein [Histoplasma mississippiense (nom. inval.)]